MGKRRRKEPAAGGGGRRRVMLRLSPPLRTARQQPAADEEEPPATSHKVIQPRTDAKFINLFEGAPMEHENGRATPDDERSKPLKPPEPEKEVNLLSGLIGDYSDDSDDDVDGMENIVTDIAGKGSSASVSSNNAAEHEEKDDELMNFLKEVDELETEEPDDPAENAESKVLPPGWQECLDVSTGEAYYWNTQTNKTSWDFPGPEQEAASPQREIGAAPMANDAVSEADTEDAHSQVDEPQGAELDPESALSNEIAKMAELLSSKFSAFAVVASSVTTLQMHLIAMQTRHSDWKSGKLDSTYYLTRLKEVSAALTHHQETISPTGWMCEWDASKQEYYYRHKRSGKTLDTYPGASDTDKFDAEFKAAQEENLRPPSPEAPPPPEPEGQPPPPSQPPPPKPKESTKPERKRKKIGIKAKKVSSLVSKWTAIQEEAKREAVKSDEDDIDQQERNIQKWKAAAQEEAEGSHNPNFEAMPVGWEQKLAELRRKKLERKK